jgi:hypothetical protein
LAVLQWVIFDRSRRFGLSVDVRFAPKDAEVAPSGAALGLSFVRTRLDEYVARDRVEKFILMRPALRNSLRRGVTTVAESRRLSAIWFALRPNGSRLRSARMRARRTFERSLTRRAASRLVVGSRPPGVSG